MASCAGAHYFTFDFAEFLKNAAAPRKDKGLLVEEYIWANLLGGSHRAPRARCFIHAQAVKGLLGSVGFGSAGFPSKICYRSLSRLRLQETSFF